MVVIFKRLSLILVCLNLIIIFGNGLAISGRTKPDVSKAGHRVKKQLSDEEHYQDLDHDGQPETHNRDFDHEAFLGSEDEASEFDQLPPEESKARLAAIVELIDVNHDGNVTETELKQWIYNLQRRYILEDVDRQWAAHNDQDSAAKTLTWEKFRNKTYGFIDEIKRDPDGLKTYADMLKRDERRWLQADTDGDGALNKEEFVLFLHPEESAQMHAVVIEETLEDMDRDSDGRISESEYISDLYTPEDEHSQYVPEWVTREREQFRAYRDQNKDGYLDRDEIKQWIVPTDYDNSEAEAKHLIYEADSNKDGVLSKDEILENYDVFVGSQATDFGEALAQKVHEEF